MRRVGVGAALALVLSIEGIYLSDANSGRRVLDSGEQGVGESRVKAHRRACGTLPTRCGDALDCWKVPDRYCRSVCVAAKMCLSQSSSACFPAAGDGKRMRGWDAGHVPLSARNFLQAGGRGLSAFVEAGPHSTRAENGGSGGKLEQPRQDLGLSVECAGSTKVLETPSSLRRLTRLFVQGNGRSRGMHRNPSKMFSEIPDTYSECPQTHAGIRHRPCTYTSYCTHWLQIITTRDDPRPSPREPMNMARTLDDSLTVPGSPVYTILIFHPRSILFYSIHLVSPWTDSCWERTGKKPKEPSNHWYVLMCDLGHRQ